MPLPGMPYSPFGNLASVGSMVTISAVRLDDPMTLLQKIDFLLFVPVRRTPFPIRDPIFAISPISIIRSAKIKQLTVKIELWRRQIAHCIFKNLGTSPIEN